MSTNGSCMSSPVPLENTQRGGKLCSRLFFAVGSQETLGEVEEETALGPKDLFKEVPAVYTKGSPESPHGLNILIAGLPASVSISSHLLLLKQTIPRGWTARLDDNNALNSQLVILKGAWSLECAVFGFRTPLHYLLVV